MIFVAGMGLLESDGKRCILGADQLIGREPSAFLRLEDESVSWRHASLRWTGHVWELQDLGSRNGTFVNGQLVPTGSRTCLRLGSELRFGSCAQSFVLADAGGPVTSVVELGTGQRITAADDLIALPHEAAPELFISCDVRGKWIAEHGERVWELEELEVLSLGAAQYRFEPAAAVYATKAGASQQLTPRSLSLDFLVSRDEEYVEVTIVHGAGTIPLRPRAHGYLLLTLARLRQADDANQLGPESRGWVHQDRLLKMLATSPTQLALDIHRARKQFSESGVSDAAQLVERRSTTRELRLGVPHSTIRVA